MVILDCRFWIERLARASLAPPGGNALGSKLRGIKAAVIDNRLHWACDVRSTLNLVQIGIRLAKFHAFRQYNCRNV